MYIQDKVEEYADEVFDLLNNGAVIYFCGGLAGWEWGAGRRPCEPKGTLLLAVAPGLCRAS